MQLLTNKSYEDQYIAILRDIYKNGYADGVNERTKIPTKRLPGQIMQIDLEKEFPILRSKFVAGKTALNEILWIWQAQSSNIKDLNAHIWDAWADEHGSIHRAYGAQIARPVNIYTDPIHRTPESFRSYPDQCHYILDYLKEFPNGRWGVATLWAPGDLYDMNLVPCCHTTTWNLDGGRLNCILDQRSGDMPYGVPFNTTQYAELTILFARHLGVKPGILTHVIADAHIYANQMTGVGLQLHYYDLMYALETGQYSYADDLADRIIQNKTNNGTAYESAETLKQKAKEVLYEAKPVFSLEEGAPVDFFEIRPEHCKIKAYNKTTGNMGPIDFGDVAV